MAYAFKQIEAHDPNNPGLVAPNASVTIFEPGDPAKTPLTITTLTGEPLANPVTVNGLGYGPAFMHATLPQVAWSGGGLTGTFESYEGMRDEAIAAVTAAENAAANAAAEAKQEFDARVAAGEFVGPAGVDGANVLPTQEAIEQAIINDGPAKDALDTTYRPGVVLPKPSGGDDGPTIAAAITSAVTKGLPLIAPHIGAVYLTSQTLLLPSGLEFIGDVITIKARPNLNAPVFKNSDQTNGNTNIRIVGVTADYDRANQSGQANVWDIENITHSKFENIGAKNGKHVGPNLGIGVGFSLRKAVYCTVRALYAEGNQWDGMQMSGCTYNEVSDVTSVNNGRAGLQITRWPVGSGTLKSAYNRINGLTTRHDTGTPSALAPCTSGLYFHMSEYNVCTNINSYGTQQGVGMIEASNGNVITTGQHQIRFDGTRGIIDIEGDCHSNVIDAHVTRGLAGDAGIHVRFSGGPNTVNVVKGIRATQGAWTGTSRVLVSAADVDNTVEIDTANGANGITYDVLGTRNSVRFRSITTGEIIRRTSGNVDGANTFLPLQGSTPATPSSGVVLYTTASGTLGILDNTGKVTEMGYGILRMPTGSAFPSADSTRRGQVRLVHGGAGVADSFAICVKKADDTYEWRAL